MAERLFTHSVIGTPVTVTDVPPETGGLRQSRR
jgi:hypothetical protein